MEEVVDLTEVLLLVPVVVILLVFVVEDWTGLEFKETAFLLTILSELSLLTIL